MLRRNVIGIVAVALFSAAALAAQVKEMPRTPIKPINESKVVDINTGTETDLVNLGIERAVAKKIVDGRPYRTKRDLVTRQVLTRDQYDKFKSSLVARRPSTAKKG
jgi:DNA uptake protein ComE-like DNA-binding protein